MMMGIGMKMRRRGGVRATLASLLAKYGTNAHAWLPGASGVSVSGLPTNNYLLSGASTGYSSTDSVVGLVLDGLGAWEDVPQNWVKASGDGVVTAVGNIITITGATTTTNVDLSPAHPFVDGYLKAEFTATLTNATGPIVYIAGGASVPVNGTRTTYGVSSKNSTLDRVQIDSGTATFVIHSLRLNRGIFASQATTSNKCLLKKDAGNRFYWQFDATDLLTSTFPAGYEAATVINILSAGQVTTENVNMVGSYSIGPSVNSYGRIVFKTAPSAADLAAVQALANKLAGL